MKTTFLPFSTAALAVLMLANCATHRSQGESEKHAHHSKSEKHSSTSQEERPEDFRAVKAPNASPG